MNRWKVFALIMIALLAVAVGFRFAYIETHSFSLSGEQKIFAINAVREGMSDETGIENYTVNIPDHGRIIPTVNGDRKVVRVILVRENITLTALVDMDTGELVEKSKIESRGWMTGFRNNNSTRIWRMR